MSTGSSQRITFEVIGNIYENPDLLENSDGQRQQSDSIQS
jgi:hypothetical protein